MDFKSLDLLFMLSYCFCFLEFYFHVMFRLVIFQQQVGDSQLSLLDSEAARASSGGQGYYFFPSLPLRALSTDDETWADNGV